MKKKASTKKVFTKRSIGLAFMLSAALGLLLLPLNAEALSRSASNNLSLADRDSITLDYGEYWLDETLNHQAIAPYWDSRVIACNSGAGVLNVNKNHYGLYTHPAGSGGAPIFGHAWSFTLEYHSDKGAYTVKTEMPKGSSAQGGVTFESCYHPWWNLADKKTADGTRIQSYDGGDKKAENLFWVSYNTFTQHYRIWSALAGKPVGYTSNDSSNLRIVSQYDTATNSQYFDMHTITYTDLD